VFVVKNVNKASVLAWIAILLFVFSCESKVEKELAMVEKELKKHENKLIEDSIYKYNEWKRRSDSIASYINTPTAKDSLRKIKYAEAEANIKRYKDGSAERIKKLVEAGIDTVHASYVDSINLEKKKLVKELGYFIE
jgi:hypothetical protein